ncbi:MAG: hypothetical protein RMA76_37080 [Deltaproteobacteria bacterium]|jgi:hypothetical protein
MTPRSPALALAFALAACGDTVFLGDLVAPDGSVDYDGGRDGGFDEERDGGDVDGGPPELVGRYQLVFQSNPARVICTDDLEDLADPLGMRTAATAGLADGYTELAMAQDYLALSGLDTRANFTADPLVLTRETRRPTVFTGAAAVDEPASNGMTFVLVVVQIETSDPESGILRSNVQHKLERAGARGQCTVDYQLTLYACGIGC